MPDFRKKGYITSLDIGSSTIRCFIATKEQKSSSLEVLGYGIKKSKGIQKGMIVNIQEAVESIQEAVLMAEKTAKLHISSVVVNISSSLLNSRLIDSEIPLEEDYPISSALIRKLIDKTLQKINLYDEDVILQMPLAYLVNGEDVGKDPRGQLGKTLGVKLHVLSFPRNQMKNIETVLGKCRLDIDLRQATAYASALSCLSEDEKQVGATLIDMGAETTSIAVFSNGQLVKALTLPLGGNLITRDIAQSLHTSFEKAELLKTKEGSAFTISKDRIDTLEISVTGDNENLEKYSIKRSYLNEIIESRIDEILETVKNCLDALVLYRAATHRIVLTGGASQLRGLREKATHILTPYIRMGKPESIKGVPDFLKESASAGIGLLKYAEAKGPQKKIKTLKKTGFFGRIIQWLIQNF